MWFGSFNVSNIAFLLTPEELNSGRIPPLNGTQNMYFVRYTEWFRQYGKLVDFWSFSSTVGYAFCVFSSIAHIQSKVDKVMYRTGASQGDRAYVKTFLPADCWYFIRSFFINYGDSINFTQIKKRVCTKISTYNLTQKQARMETVLEIVEGDIPAAIKQMAQLFGNSFWVGVWKMFPKWITCC